MPIKSLTIYCSSSNFLDNEYYKLAENLGFFLANRQIRIIYGGGDVGMMGKISNSANKKGGEVIGIIPKFLINKEIKNTKITKTIVVKTMSERKNKLFELGDAFLVLPGGSGTIEEATEIISWKLLGLHNKDIYILNYKGYWNNFFDLYKNAKKNKFGKKNLQSICINIKSFNQFKKIFN